MAVGLGSTFEEVIKKINSCGDVTAAGNNTFTGSNVFKKAVTLYTDAVNGNSISATLDSYKLKLFNDLGGVYADLNITDDTAPYLELKTAGHGKVKYTPESIIFTDTYGSSKTTTLKFPGQGATADSIQTLATNEDLDKKQPLLVSGTNIKTINGQSILGEGDLEISGGGGSGGSNGGAYAHLVSFGFYRTDDSDIAGWGSIMIPSSSADTIVGTSVDNLKTFLAKFNGKFYPMAIKTDGYTTTPYTGIFVNPTNNSLNVVASASSGGNAEFTIDVYDITETVVQTSTGGGGGSGSVDLEPIVKGQHKLNKGEQLTIQQGYTYFVQCFDTSDNIAEFEIVGGNRNGEKGKFVMLLSGQGDNLAILQTGSIVISNFVKTAVRVEAIKPASNSSYLAYYEISGYASSTKTLNVGGGSPDSNATVLISVASTNSYRTDPLDQLSQHKIRVRVISGSLQAGDRLEICRPIAKKAYNRVNGMQTNIRYRQKLKACAYKILTETDIANIAAGKNILVLTVNHSTDQPNKGLKYTCTSNNSTFRGSAPRVIRIVRPTPYGQNGIMQNIQISNSVYVTRSYGSNVIKGM